MNNLKKKHLMTLQKIFDNRLTIPAIASPMFLASGPRLVIECCKSGMVGTFPALNPRTTEALDQWLNEITRELIRYEKESGCKAAPYGVNLIVHKSNTRLAEDLAVCIKHKVPLIITSLGAVGDVVDSIHAYGGVVFHDVTTIKHAKKAASVGVDGLIAVAAGAGGHAGTLSPFSFVNEIKQFYDKTVVLAGCISTGRDIAAARMLGADLAYMGTRMLATQECQVQQSYKDLIVDVYAVDIVYTPAISGVNANFIKQSVEKAGMDIEGSTQAKEIDFGAELDEASDDSVQGAKPWKDIWSAGQGVGSVKDIPTAKALIARLADEYQQARASV